MVDYKGTLGNVKVGIFGSKKGEILLRFELRNFEHELLYLHKRVYRERVAVEFVLLHLKR
jgi:hypothetical protein